MAVKARTVKGKVSQSHVVSVDSGYECTEDGGC